MNRPLDHLSIGPISYASVSQYTDKAMTVLSEAITIQVQALDLHKSVVGPGGSLTILEGLDLQVMAGEAVAQQ